MQLPNTKRYYLDLAHYYFQEGRAELMTYFRNLADNKAMEFAKEDTNDWFAYWGHERPQRDEETGLYL